MIVLIIIVILIVFSISYFTIYKYNKELEIYLTIKRHTYNNRNHAYIMNILIVYYGFDTAGADKLIREANKNNYEFFKTLKL